VTQNGAQRAVGVAGFGHHFEVALAIENHAQTGANDGTVISQDDRDRLRVVSHEHTFSEVPHRGSSRSSDGVVAPRARAEGDCP
jgi:hypothetical protein